MFYENVILDVKAGINVKSNMELLYSGNMGLIGSIANDLGVFDYDTRNDFFQLAYIALDGAVKVYKPMGPYSFLSYFRRCLLHEFFVYRLDMQFPVRMTRTAYERFKADENFLSEMLREDNSYYIEQAFYKAEDDLVCSLLWEVVEDTLSPENFFVITERYQEEKSLKEISAEMHIGGERVRMREKRSLARLKQNADLRMLAMDYFSI